MSQLIEVSFEPPDPVLPARVANAVAGDFLTPIGRIIDPATTPLQPAKPPKLHLIALGLLAGIVIGIVAAWVREGITHVVRSSEEVESLLERLLLARLPAADRPTGRTGRVDSDRTPRNFALASFHT